MIEMLEVACIEHGSSLHALHHASCSVCLQESYYIPIVFCFCLLMLTKYRVRVNGDAGIVVAIIFAIVALRFMGGQFFSCNDGSVNVRAECIGSFINEAGVWAPRVWTKPNHNFDDLSKVLHRLYSYCHTGRTVFLAGLSSGIKLASETRETPLCWPWKSHEPSQSISISDWIALWFRIDSTKQRKCSNYKK